jgi:hypothetical protein
MTAHLISVAALVLAAQASSSQPPASDAHRVTIIGCIARSQSAVAGTTGTTAVDADSTRYILDRVSLASDPAQTTTADIIAQRISMYQLDDQDAPKIAPHVGERVEVTGTVRPPRARQAPARPGDPIPAPILKVENLRTLGAVDSCNAPR